MALLVVKETEQDRQSGHSDSQHGLSNLHLGCREGVMKGRKKLESPRLI